MIFVQLSKVIAHMVHIPGHCMPSLIIPVSVHMHIKFGCVYGADIGANIHVYNALKNACSTMMKPLM